MEIKDLIKGESYKVKGDSKYFKEKYGTTNPIFIYEDTDVNIWGKSWGLMQGNPCAMLFAVRTGFGGVTFPLADEVCYGHIKKGNSYLAELTHPSELEEIKKGQK